MARAPRPEARIYLDCDGVLADFEKGAEAVLGMSSRRFEQRFGLKAFWARLASTPDFFNTLGLMPDAMELFAAVRHREPVILTGLPRGAWAEPQKRRWAARHFPGVEVITTSSALKREHCHPRRRPRRRHRQIPAPVGEGGRRLHPPHVRRRLDRRPASPRLPGADAAGHPPE